MMTDENFLILAIKHYDNASCLSLTEFNNDLKRVKYIKKLFNKYLCENDLKERLILNHIIIIYNLFGNEFATKMLFYKIDKKYWSLLKTFLVYLNLMPDKISSVFLTDIISSDIKIDDDIATILRTI